MEATGPSSEPERLAADATTQARPPEPPTTLPVAGGSAVPEPPSTAPEAGINLGPPIRIRYLGDYEVRREVGRGGMGVVFEAHQLSLDRAVAVKILRPGMLATEREILRFRSEAESVAQLDHPLIVPIYEVGRHEGNDYFSMKLIDGRNLAHHLRELRADPRLAARLLAELADALHHAHQRGILHRDLKPSNIILARRSAPPEGATRANPPGDNSVTPPARVDYTPYLTDFGLAKRLDGEGPQTITGEVLGTPAYMSPEQATGRRSAFTIASEVYGLGAVLYAVLTGKPPHHGDSTLATLEHVKTQPIEPPRRHNAEVPRDLEAICMKALAYEPARRYSSAAAVGEDLRNWLDSRPIAARSVGPFVRSWLWCRRKPALAALSAALALSTLGGVAGITANWLEVRKQKSLVEESNVRLTRERDALAAINGFLNQDILSAGDPELVDRAERLTVEEALDRAADSVGPRFADRPDIEAEVSETLGRAYHALGVDDKAMPHMDRARELRLRLHGPDDSRTLTTSDNLALVLLGVDDLEGAERLGRSTSDTWIRIRGVDDLDTIRSRANLAAILQTRGAYDEAESLHREVVVRRIAQLGESNPDTITAKNNLATYLVTRGREAEAEQLFREVVAAREAGLRVDHPLSLVARCNLAVCLYAQRRFEELAPLLDRLLEALPRVLGAENGMTLRMRSFQGGVMVAQGRASEAIPLLEGVLTMRKGRSSSGEMEAYNNLAMALVAVDRLEDAEPYMRECLARAGDEGDPTRSDVDIRSRYGVLLLDLGRNEEAAAHLGWAVGQYRRLLSPDHLDFAAILLAHGSSLVRSSRAEEALPILSEALKIRVGRLPAEHPQIASAESALGGAYLALGRLDEAKALLVPAAERVLGSDGLSPARKAHVVDRVVVLYELTGDEESAARWRERRPHSTRQWSVPRP